MLFKRIGETLLSNIIFIMKLRYQQRHYDNLPLATTCRKRQLAIESKRRQVATNLKKRQLAAKVKTRRYASMKMCALFTNCLNWLVDRISTHKRLSKRTFTSIVIDKLNRTFLMWLRNLVYKHEVLQKVYLKCFPDIYYVAMQTKCM